MSIRKQRGRIVMCCFALVIGVIAICLPQKWRMEALVPGPLSKGHAQILNRESVDNRCAACHAAGNETMAGWLSLGFSRSQGSHETQSLLCLKCHEKSFDRQHALAAHGVSPEILNEISAGKTHLVNADEQRITNFANHDLACSTCHREHHGANHDLAKISDRQCANCHTDSFHKFSDHPEYTNWPDNSDSRIAFNHTSHQFQHFANAEQAFDCNACHLKDGSNEVVSVVGFDSCRTCHESKIANPTGNPLIAFAIPMIDTDSLSNAGFKVASWPENATGDCDGKISPLMRLLLSTDPKLKPFWECLGADCDLINIDVDQEWHLKAAAGVAQAITRLVDELANEGPRNRLNGALPGVNNTELARQIPRHLFQVARSNWFDGGLAASDGDALATDSPEDEDRLNNASSNSGSSDSGSSDSGFSDSDDDGLRDNDGLRDDSSDQLLDDEGSTSEDSESDLLDDSDDEDLLGHRRHDIEVLSVRDHRILPVSYDSESVADLGWYIDNEFYAIGYRPTGHADPVLKSLLEAIVALPRGAESTATKSLISEITKVTATGQCMSCHRVQTKDGKSSIEWQRTSNIGRSFTKFSHAPHLIQPQLRDCSHCHDVNRDAHANDADSQYTAAFVSDFHHLTKEACQTCHSPNAAGSSCLQCHNYHVDADVSHELKRN